MTAPAEPASFEGWHPHDKCPYRHLHDETMRAALENAVGAGIIPNHYVKGTRVLVTDTLTDPRTGAPVTASQATGYTVDPTGVRQTFVPTALSANVWQFGVSANKSGQWNYRMEVPPGTGEGAAEGIFFVDPSPF